MKNFFFIELCLLSIWCGVVCAEVKKDTEEGILSTDKEKSTLYSPSGKRDPFQPPSLSEERGPASLKELERFGLDALQLRGIERTKDSGKAMFEDPDGKTYIISEGDILGRERGKVSRILNTEVIVTLRTFNYLGAENIYEKVISLPQK